MQVFAQVHHGRIENHHVRFHGFQRSQHRPKYARVHHRRGHRAALVHAEHDFLQRLPAPAETHQPLRNNGFVRRLIVLEVGLDGRAPVNFVVAGPRVAHGPAQCALHRLPQRVAQLLFQLTHHFGNDFTGGGFSLLRHHPAQRHERAHEVHVGLHRAQDFGLQQQLVQAQARHGILLHDGHHFSREIRPNVAQPAAHAGRRAAQAGLALALVAVVEGSEHVIHPAVVGRHGYGVGRVGGAAEHEFPASLSRGHGCGYIGLDRHAERSRSISTAKSESNRKELVVR